MKALVYRGPGKKSLEDRPMPQIAAPTDAIVKIVKTTICGTDLHILKGDVATCAPGRILGHEGAEKYLGTPKANIRKQLVRGGHIGLFMGARTLKEA